MGFDFVNATGAAMSFSGTGWTLLLCLAEEAGWQAQGTLPPSGISPADWDGAYDTNEGQAISDDDAKTLSSALRRALVDPDRDRMLRTVAEQVSAAVQGATGHASPIGIDESYWTIIDEFVHFCQSGPVVIE